MNEDDVFDFREKRREVSVLDSNTRVRSRKL